MDKNMKILLKNKDIFFNVSYHLNEIKTSYINFMELLNKVQLSEKETTQDELIKYKQVYTEMLDLVIDYQQNNKLIILTKHILEK
jgi:hypothetical protein